MLKKGCFLLCTAASGKLTFVLFLRRLLVGAPRADARQPGVHKGGAVYKCPALQSGGCEIIPFDKGGKGHGPMMTE